MTGEGGGGWMMGWGWGPEGGLLNYPRGGKLDLKSWWDGDAKKRTAENVCSFA